MIEVLLDFDDQDEPVISVKGVKGKACKDLTRELEFKLGKVTKEEKTGEYREEEVKHGNRVSNRR